MRQQKIIFEPVKNCILGHRSFIYKMNFSKKCHFLSKKCIFFDKKCNIYPCPTSSNFDVKKLFIPLVFIYFNSEGFVGGGWRRWWNPPLNIFNLAKNGPFLEDLKKKVSKSHWNHIHKVCVTQIHYVTWFLTPFLLKMPQFLLKTLIFVTFKNSHFCLFPGVLHGKL